MKMKKTLSVILSLITLISMVMIGGSNAVAATSNNETNITNTTNTTKVCKTHKYGKGVVTRKATCTKTGVKTYTCTKCGATKTKTIDKVAHTYVVKADTRATTKSNGKATKRVCTVCGKAIKLKKAVTIYKVTSIKISKTGYSYNGKVQKPTVSVKDSKGNKLKKNVDYTVTYSNDKSTKVGTYKVTVKLIGKYKGSKTLTYKITEKSHSYRYVADTKATFTKNGKATYKICDGCGKKVKLSKAVTIAKVSTVKLSKTKYSYDGNKHVPVVSVIGSDGKKLVKNKDYTLTYSNSKSTKTGKYTVTVKLMGNYKGSKVLEYSIVKPASGTKKAVTGVEAKNITEKVTYKRTTKNSSYPDLDGNGAGMKWETATRTVGRGIRVTWDKVNDITAYQVQYSLRKDFAVTDYEYKYALDKDGKEVKTVKIDATTTESIPAAAGTTYVINGTLERTYYIRVRAIFEKNGKQSVSPWSKTQTVKAMYNCAEREEITEYTTENGWKVTYTGKLIYGGNKNHICINEREHHTLCEAERTGRNCRYCGKDMCEGVYIYATKYKCFYPGCPKYSDKYDEICEYCGRPAYGKGCCHRFVCDGNCPYCGVKVKAWKCHVCKTGPYAP
ncbi:MAG: hypothetical protein ACI4KD_01395 [Oscillospiraceae bacterium]